jgi:hypothetical protein
MVGADTANRELGSITPIPWSVNQRRHGIQPHICTRRLVALRFNVLFYSYPRDIETVKVRIEHIRARAELAADLAGQGVDLLQQQRWTALP